MKIFTTIEELLTELQFSRKSISPDFYIFKFDEIDYAKRIDTFPHYKRFFEIAFYEENKNKVKIGHTTLHGFNNTITFTSPMQSLSILRKVQPVGISILFSSQFFKPTTHQYNIQHNFPFFKLNTHPFYKINEKERVFIKNILETIYKEYNANEAYCLEIIHSYLDILLNYIKRILEDCSEKIKLKRYEEITSCFEEMILEETERYKTIAAYASMLNITPIYLSECVKKATGLSAKKVLINYQILKAKSLLIQTDHTIEGIAHEMGFDEATNFIKFFKNNQGITPSVFRKLP